jgi:hypothetical protein
MFRVIDESQSGQRVPVRISARSVAPETLRQLQQERHGGIHSSARGSA